LARVQAQVKAKTLARAGATAQQKVGIQDQGFIDSLKKQIATLEAKKNP
jgi:hypothetical protein